MTTSRSTIVETININYDDFNESFLTCATCLYAFDTDSHRPKLLSCSHTVCKTCLERIAELPQSVDTGSFRCPICRETIPVPRSGVQSLPPSFVINQLIDLMSRQRRDLVPKCAVHCNEELLFCETCDVVFCATCSSGTPADSSAPAPATNYNPNFNPHHQASLCLNHTVVPFSIAIKRMSEILLYKANQCSKNLNRAADNVRKEMELLDTNADRVVDQVNSSFQDLNKCVERRRQELIDIVRRTRDAKRKILQEQLGIIHSEKAKVEQECNTLHSQLDVRNISRRVSDLNQKLDASSTLIEPRENSFLRYDADSSGFVMDGLQKVLSEFGSLCISKTFPPLCTAKLESPAVVNVKCQVLLTTIDYDGQNRSTGGDPVRVTVYSTASNNDSTANSGGGPTVVNTATAAIPTTLIDNGNGTYRITYTPIRAGEHKMEIKIFDRPIKNSPLIINVDAHNNPVWQFGGARASTDPDQALSQPVRVAVLSNQILILDTGNNRVKVINEEGKLLKTIIGDPLAFQSTVGLARTPSQTFVTLNWRTKCVTEWSPDLDGSYAELKSFTFSEFVEPLDLAVDSEGRILVADNGAKKVFVFDHNARPLFSFTVKSAAEISATAISQRRRRGSDEKCSTLSTPSGGSGGKPTPPPASYRHSTTGFPMVQVTCVAVGAKDEIIIAGSEIQIYDHSGRYVTNLHTNTPRSQSFFVGGLCVDEDGYVLATVNDAKSSYLNVFRHKPGQTAASTLMTSSGIPTGSTSMLTSSSSYVVDSHASKLKRPSGVCVGAGALGNGDHCFVADLGNNCIKKYRYK